MVKKGRKPISLKQPDFKYFGVGKNSGTVPESIKKWAEQKGVALRWLNTRKLKYNAGQGHNYWKPLKLTEADCATMKIDISLASDPDGFIRRGDMVLGERKMEIHTEHRKYLNFEAAKQVAAVESYGVAEMQQQAAPHNVKVVSGYDD